MSFGNGYGNHYYAGVMAAVATPVAEFINRRPTVKVLVLSFLLQEWRSEPLSQRGAGCDWLAPMLATPRPRHKLPELTLRNLGASKSRGRLFVCAIVV